MNSFHTFLAWLNKKGLPDKNWYALFTLLLIAAGVWIAWKGISNPVRELQKGVEKLESNLLYNAQDIKTSRMSGEAIVQTYYDLISKLDFEQSCTLLSKRMCDADDQEHYARYLQESLNYHTRKLKSPERLLETWKAPIQNMDDNSELWCAKTSFVLDGESSEIDQVWRFKVLTRPDGNKEIASKHCEKAFKQGLGDRSLQMGCNADANCVLK